MSKKEILAYCLVGILALIVTFSFLKIFAFEKKKDKNEVNYPDITDKLITETIAKIPEYRSYYIEYSSLDYNTILKTIYNYILIYNKDMIKQETDNIAKINSTDFDKVGKKIFGSDVAIPRQDFVINESTKAQYIDNYYEITYSENTLNNLEENIYSKYEITDGGEKLIIYNKYIICEKDTNVCYQTSDKKKTIEGITITNDKIDISNNDNKLKTFKHEFKYQDGYYYWVSSKVVE